MVLTLQVEQKSRRGHASRARVCAGNLRLSVGEGLLGALGTHDSERADDKLLKTCDLRKVLAPHLLVGEHVVHQLGIVAPAWAA